MSPLVSIGCCFAVSLQKHRPFCKLGIISGGPVLFSIYITTDNLDFDAGVDTYRPLFKINFNIGLCSVQFISDMYRCTGKFDLRHWLK